MKKTFSIIGLTMLTGALLLTSCYKDNEEELYPATNCDLTNVTFKATIMPIMTASCASSGCHDAATASSGIDLTTYAGAKAIADNGKLIGSITHASGFSAMPKNASKLSDCNISKIQKWIADGAANN